MCGEVFDACGDMLAVCREVLDVCGEVLAVFREVLAVCGDMLRRFDETRLVRQAPVKRTNRCLGRSAPVMPGRACQATPGRYIPET